MPRNLSMEQSMMLRGGEVAKGQYGSGREVLDGAGAQTPWDYISDALPD